MNPAADGIHARARALATIALIAILTAAPGAHAQTFEDYPHTVDAPYAGRYEARIGGSSEPADAKLRLDIGASIDIFAIRDSTTPAGMVVRERNRLSFGADFFTWSRLRSEPNFKFPVEDVDYYFGVNTSLRLARIAGHPPLISEVRLRVAHISAHLVDGDPRFAQPGDSSQALPAVYSREFVDGMIAADGERIARALGAGDASLRPYLGVLYLFHVVPAVESHATPYAGIDAWFVPFAQAPLVVKAGYEARLNTEGSAPIGEHQARVGLKLGRPHSNGVLLEAAYTSGRSVYGQLFGRRESYLSLGFAIDY